MSLDVSSQKETTIEPQDGGEGSVERRSPAASPPVLFESRAWQRVMEETYGFTFYQARHPDVQAVLPFAVAGRDLHRRAVSLPFSDYVVTDDVHPRDYRALADVVRAALPAHPLVLKTTFPHDTEGLGAVERKAYYHRVPTPSHDAVDANVTSSFKNKVRQAERAGVRVRRAKDAGAVKEFLSLHRALRFEKFGKIPQPRRFFAALRRAFVEAGCGFVMEATRKGEVIAALMALRHRDTLYYKFSASAKEHLEHRPNNLLMHALLHHAVDNACRDVDLGLSGAGPAYKGLRSFKESFGGEPHPVTQFRLDPPGYDRATEKELEALLGALTETIVEQELDADATDAFSRLLYPYFV